MQWILLAGCAAATAGCLTSTHTVELEWDPAACTTTNVDAFARHERYDEAPDPKHTLCSAGKRTFAWSSPVFDDSEVKSACLQPISWDNLRWKSCHFEALFACEDDDFYSPSGPAACVDIGPELDGRTLHIDLRSKGR